MGKKIKRYDWLISLIQNNGYTIGAEIGCAKGMTTYRLLKHCPDLLLYAVDLWEYSIDVLSDYSKQIYQDWNFEDIRNTFDQQTAPYQDRLIILQGVSWKMADHMENGSLDFVFIDADHAYQSVKNDIYAWLPKLKSGGVLCGHDYNLDGVRQAIDEMIPEKWKDSQADHVWYCYKEEVDVSKY